MGAGVAIPIINQRVDTPSFDAPANPLRAEPVQSNVGAAISDAGDSLMGIWKQQQQQQNALDLADRMGNFQQQIGAAKVAALSSGKQAPDMIKGFQSDASELIGQFIADPTNRAIAPQLSILMRDHLGREMGGFSSEATLQVHHDTEFRATSQIDGAAQTAAANFDPNTLQDTATGKDLTDHAHAMIAGIYDPKARPVEFQVATAKFDQAKDVERASLIAQNQPSALTPYLTANTGKFSADEISHFRALSLGTLRQHSEIVSAGVAEDHATAINTLDAMKQAHDPGLAAKTAALYRTGYVDSREADRYVPGFEPPSNDRLVKDFREQIRADAGSIDPAQFITDQINSPDRQRLNAEHAFYLKREKTDVGKADKIVRQQISESLTPTDPAVLAFRDDREKAELVKQRALAQYESGILDAKSGADVYKLGESIMKQFHARPITLPPLPPTVPPTSIPSAADRIRGAGLGR